MKKLFSFISFLFLIACASFITGCKSDTSVSERTILRQYNKALKLRAENVRFDIVEIGKYECNDETKRLMLRQLAEAGLIKYDVKRYAWWEKSKKASQESYTVQRSSWWGGTYDDIEYRTVYRDKFEFEDHYIVEVKLTRKGESLTVSELPQPTVEEDKDLKQPEVNPAKYSWNKKDLSENWPEINNPFLPEQKKNVSQQRKSADSGKKESSSGEDRPAVQDNVERNDYNQYAQYRNLCLKHDVVYVKLCEIEACKARNIRILSTLGVKSATAEVIVRLRDVTDFGRIMWYYETNERFSDKVSLDYYLDRGWVLKHEEQESED